MEEELTSECFLNMTKAYISDCCFLKNYYYIPYFLSAVEAGIKFESKYIHMAFWSSSNLGHFCSVYSQMLISRCLQSYNLKQYLDN